LKYIFAVRKGGAVPGSIPGGTTSLNRKTRKINVLRVFVLKGVTDSVQKPDGLITSGQLNWNYRF